MPREKFDPLQWLRIWDGYNYYRHEGHDDLRAEDPKAFWAHQREKEAAAKLARWAMYQAMLGHELTQHWDELGNHPDQIADFVMRALFEWRDVEDPDRACPCACHPRLGNDDYHEYGFACRCGRTAEEREANSQTWAQRWAELHDTPEMQQWHAEDKRRMAEARQWLDTEPELRDVSQLSMACPEQWQGICNDYPFYFRERHGEWRIELSTKLAPGAEPVHVVDTEFARGFESYYETDGYEVIARGVDEDLGHTPVEHLQFIVRTIREYLVRTTCPVDHLTIGTNYCPNCGVKLG